MGHDNMARDSKPGGSATRVAAVTKRRGSRGLSGKTAKPTRHMRRGTSAEPKATRVAKRAAVVSSPALSKDELRSRMEKLERANANLRATNRTLKRAAEEAAERI